MLGFVCQAKRHTHSLVEPQQLFLHAHKDVTYP